ncbi:MAG: ribonuclease P protein component [Flavobacteriaceae bacterium]
MSPTKNNIPIYRLKGKERIDNLFRTGKSIRHKGLHLRYIKNDKEQGASWGVSVPKRLVHLAVDRNRIKRQLRALIKTTDFIPFKGSAILIYSKQNEPDWKSLKESFQNLLLKYSLYDKEN